MNLKRFLIILGITFITTFNIKVNASGLQKIRCTCYCDEGITASGHNTRDGIIAGRKSDLGRVAAVYRCDTAGMLGEFIGYYEFLDTGAGIDTNHDGIGDSIKKGLSVDIYKSTLTEAYDWITEYGDYVYIQYIDAEG